MTPTSSNLPPDIMDLVLHIADDWILDKAWARIVPLSAFAYSSGFTGSFNSTAKYLALTRASSTWSQLVSHLPHPPLSYNEIASLYSNPQAQLVSGWPRDYILRQILSLSFLTLLGIHLLYFVFAGLSFQYIFNHEMMRHPRFLKNQVKLEIQTSLKAFPVMTLLTLPWFQAEVMGYSKLYDGADTYGYFYLFASVILWVTLFSLTVALFMFFVQVSFVHRLLYLLDTSMAAYSFHLQAHPQASSQMD